MNRNAKSLQAKAKLHDVRPSGRGQFVVTSGTSNKEYRVFALQGGGFACSCKFGRNQRLGMRPCSHTIAVENYLESLKGRILSVWSTKMDADRQHRPVERVGLNLWSTSRLEV